MGRRGSNRVTGAGSVRFFGSMLLGLQAVTEDIVLLILELVRDPTLLARLACSGNHWLRSCVDNPSLWLRLCLPTFSQRNLSMLHSTARKVDKVTLGLNRDEREDAGWRIVNLVLEGLTRGCGSTTIADALCGTHTGMRFVTDRDVKKDPSLNTDMVVRSVLGEVNGQPVDVRVKDRKITAQATPFAAALFSKPHTVIAIIIDLSTDMGLQYIAAELDKKLSHFKQHAAGEVPTLLVGSKPMRESRTLPFNKVVELARERGLPYVEGNALKPGDVEHDAQGEWSHDKEQQEDFQEISLVGNSERALAMQEEEEALSVELASGVITQDAYDASMKRLGETRARLEESMSKEEESAGMEASGADLDHFGHEGMSDFFHLVLVMTDGLESLYMSPGEGNMAERALDRVGSQKAGVTEPFIGNFLDELKAKAEGRE